MLAAAQGTELPRTIESSPLPRRADLELLRHMLLTREIEAHGAGPGREPLARRQRRSSVAGVVAAAGALGPEDHLFASAAYAGAHLARGLAPARAPSLPPAGDWLALAAGSALAAQLERQSSVGIAIVPAPALATERATRTLALAASRALPLIVIADEEADERGSVEAALPVAAGLGLEVEALDGPAPEIAFAATRDALAGARAGTGPKLVLMPTVADADAPRRSEASGTDPLAAFVRRLLAHGHSRKRLQDIRSQAEEEAHGE